ncbi:UNKNOWN [Stylonychia lemnae]|uniref:Uncharacterized protein n=1 Tax=Stylonychia lemnae TaxID=5949 RepID=A0A078A7V8_STYLE|nr:UNKNOWN [Stylonychia lemnae]|eukprot:CDW77657.1 UNKNOWN [Stylonychia lemnae]
MEVRALVANTHKREYHEVQKTNIQTITSHNELAQGASEEDDNRHQLDSNRGNQLHEQNGEFTGKSQILVNIASNSKEDLKLKENKSDSNFNRAMNENEILQSYFDKSIQLLNYNLSVAKNDSDQQQIQDQNNQLGYFKYKDKRKQMNNVQKQIEKTLKTQNNCFLPNYKQNTMMKRFKPNVLATDLIKNDKRNKMLSKSFEFNAKTKKIKKLRKMNNVVVGVNISPKTTQQQIVVMNHSTQEIQMIDSTDIMKNPEKVIKIQTVISDPKVRPQDKHQSRSFALQKKQGLKLKNQQSSSLGAWKVQNHHQSSPSNNNKSSEQHSRGNYKHQHIVFDQNSSKLSFDQASPLNTELAMFDDIRQMQPRNLHQQPPANIFQQSILKQKEISQNSELKHSTFNKNILVRDDEINNTNQSQQKRKNTNSFSMDSKLQFNQLTEDHRKVFDSQNISSDNHKRHTSNIQPIDERGIKSSIGQLSSGQNEYLSKSIEVVVQRTSHSNSKITSFKDSTPNNIQYRNIYGNSAYIMTPKHTRIQNNQEQIENAKPHTMNIKFDDPHMKKIVLKKQQIKALKDDYADHIYKGSTSQRSQNRQQQDNIIMNHDLVQFGIKVKTKTLKSSKTIRQDNERKAKKQKSNKLHLQQLQLEENKQIQDKDHQSSSLNKDNPYVTSSMTAHLVIQNGIYDTVTQESNMQKLGLVENRYEQNEGSPFIYKSKEKDIQSQVQTNNHLQVPQESDSNMIITIDRLSVSRHIQSHSVTPMCEPIYPDLATDASKEKFLRNFDENDHRMTIDLHQSYRHYKNKSSKIYQVTNNNGRSDNETLIQQQQQQLQVSLKDIQDETLETQYFNMNQDLNFEDKQLLEQIKAMTKDQKMAYSLYWQIEQQRKREVQDQTHKFNPYIYQRKQEDEENRLLSNRIKKIKERQQQSLGVSGTNIKTIGQKIVDYVRDQYDHVIRQQVQQALVNFHEQVQLQQAQQQNVDQSNINSMSPLHKIVDKKFKNGNTESLTNSDLMLMSGGLMMSQNQKLQNKYGQNTHRQNLRKGDGSMAFNSDIGMHLDNSNLSKSPIRSPHIVGKSQTVSKSQSQRKRIHSQNKHIINQINKDIKEESQIVTQNTQKQQQDLEEIHYYYSPTPNEQSRSDLLIYQDKTVSGQSIQQDSSIAIQNKQLNQDSQAHNEYTFDIQREIAESQKDFKTARISNIYYEDQTQSKAVEIPNDYVDQFMNLNIDSHNISHQQLKSNKQEDQQLASSKFQFKTSQHRSNANFAYHPQSINSNYSANKQSFQRKTLEESDRTSYRITRPLLHPDFNLLTQNATPNIIDRPVYERSADYELKLNEIKKEQIQTKIAKSYSKMMNKIGMELRNVGPKSLKNLSFLQGKQATESSVKEIMLTNFSQNPNNLQLEQITHPKSQSMPRHQRKRHEIHVNITASISTASFKGDRAAEFEENNQGTAVSAFKIKQGRTDFNLQSARQKIKVDNKGRDYYSNNRYNSMSQNEDQLNDSNLQQIRDAKYKHSYMMNESQLVLSQHKESVYEPQMKVFDERDHEKTKVLMMKTSRLSQRLGGLSKSQLQNSFAHNNRKVVTTQNKSKVIQSFQNIVPTQMSGPINQYGARILNHPSSLSSQQNLNAIASSDNNHYGIQSNATLNKNYTASNKSVLINQSTAMSAQYQRPFTGENIKRLNSNNRQRMQNLINNQNQNQPRSHSLFQSQYGSQIMQQQQQTYTDQASYQNIQFAERVSTANLATSFSQLHPQQLTNQNQENKQEFKQSRLLSAQTNDQRRPIHSNSKNRGLINNSIFYHHQKFAQMQKRIN